MKKIIASIALLCLTILISGCGMVDTSTEQKKSTKKGNSGYRKEGKSIYFGYYPQTNLDYRVESDFELINTLNEEIGDFDKNKWVSYNYFEDYSARHSEMYYLDYDRDNDGMYDYRAVYIDRDTSDSYNSWRINEKNGFFGKMVHWFKYEEIKWDILEEKDGKALIISNFVLDSQPFQYMGSGSNYDYSFDHNGGNGYGNNYELSDIRKWLNETFYNSAFDYENKKYIEQTSVDNSSDVTRDTNYNAYASSDTVDNIFLLSYKEALSYYNNDAARIGNTSDYAKCQGAYSGSATWMLRTPYNEQPFDIDVVHSQGFVDYSNAESCSSGIRPVIWIEL